MATSNVMAEAFELVLSAPGMGNVSKINLNISSKNLLLLNFLIESGISGEGDTSKILENFPAESKQELQQIADEMLEKGQLHDTKEKLKKFQK